MLEIFKKRSFGVPGLISILILTIIIGLLAFKTRNDQWNIWKLNKDITFYENSPLLSTADGPYFVGLSKTINEGETLQSFNEKRFFPENQKKFKSQKDLENLNKFKISLLPISISYFSKYFDNNLLLTSNILIPLTALLTAISISLFFFSLGFGYEGVIAGLGASLSQSILVRTSIGRVDTDLLNIGFFYTVLTFIYSSIKTNNYLYKFISISLAGLANFFFIWWYQRPGFFVLFLLTIIILQVFCKQGLRKSFLQILIFSLFSGPNYVIESFDNIINYINLYLNFSINEPTNTGLLFPDTLKTVTELKKLDLFEYSKFVFGEKKDWIVLLGFLGLITFVFFNFQKSLTLIAPIIFLLFSFLIGKRFAIYAIPLYWFGVAYLLITVTLLINYFFQLQKFINLPVNIYSNLLVSFSTIFLIFIIVTTSISYCKNNNFFSCKPKYVPQPSFSKEITKAFDSFNSNKYDKSSIIVTWWDYGYWLNYFSGLSSVHDGGSQTTPKTYLVANSLSSSSQIKSYNNIKYLTSSSLDEILYDSSKEKDFFMRQIINARKISRPVYLFLSKDMIFWWPTITYLGNWDIVNGLEKDKTIFNRINCKPKSQIEMICENDVINVNNGLISNGNKLDSLVISQDGKMIRRFDYQGNGQFSLLIDIVNENRFFYVISPNTLESTFTKLFFLNTYNNNLFQLIEDGYPFYKIFKVN